MIVFIVKVDDLDFLTVDPKRHPPVLSDEQAPRSFAVASQHMGFPALQGAKLVFLLHVLKEGNDTLHFDNNSGLQPTGVIILDETPQPFMDYVPDFHNFTYPMIRSASSDAIQFCMVFRCALRGQAGLETRPTPVSLRRTSMRSKRAFH
jgi:hypothetical protein